jgi:3-keto-disaccharide hydrolase
MRVRPMHGCGFLRFIPVLFLIATASGAGQEAKKAELGGKPLFDGKTLTNWQPTKFYGEGPVKVENGQIVLEAGSDLTGVTWTGPELPTTNYELTLQAMRVQGRDFFAGVTFPVGDSFCSLILGGWGGQVVGLSSINGMDASENETSQSVEFESGKWYDIRIRVTPAKIQAWLDTRQIIDVNLKGNEITTRIEMDKSKPLGVASFRTKAALRDIRLRQL